MTLAAKIIDWRSPDYVPVIAERARYLASMRADPMLMAAVKKYYTHATAEACCDFIDAWVWTYDPRSKPAWRPMVLFQRQRELIHWVWARYSEGEDGLVEKTRDSGATYISMSVAVYLWLFVPGSKVGFGSRKEMLVDRLGDPDSIFEKGRSILARLPKEFLPQGFDVRVHCAYMRIVNPANGNTITGEAGDNIGRGGRSTMYFKDESAYYEHADKIDAALSENSNIKIDISTVNGANNAFARRRHGGMVPVFTLHWRDDPRKGQEWRDARGRSGLPEHIIAQEIDINYNSATDLQVFPAAWVEAAIGADITSPGVIVAGYDVADEGADANALVARRGANVLAAKTWRQGTTTESAQRVWMLCSRADVERIVFDSIGVGAGTRGELKRLEELDTVSGYRPVVVAFRGGDSPTPGFYAPGKSNKSMFKNIKAQLYWELRDRLYRTYQYISGVQDYPHDDLLSIPLFLGTQFRSELSQIQYNTSRDDGLLVIDKKPNGCASPNLVDALVMSFAARRTVAVA